MDQFADYALRGATADQLGTALARSFAEFNAWYGQARFIAAFAGEARIAGVQSVVAERIRESLDFGEATGLILTTSAKTKSNAEIAKELANHQLLTADLGVSIAAIVMLHNAYERLLWRLVRFGLIANRTKAIEWIANRKVTVDVIAQQEHDIVIDGQIEKWWNELERESLLKKWDSLVGLVGFPKELNDQAWKFDRDTVSCFDDVRHNAVHHDGQAVRDFDLGGFSTQLWRAQLVWLVHVAIALDVKIPGELLYSAPT